jgi:hypothetical protein
MLCTAFLLLGQPHGSAINIANLNEDQVGSWLSSELHGPDVVERFASEGVDGQVLLAFSTHANGKLLQSELKELGLFSLRSRVTFMGALGRLLTSSAGDEAHPQKSQANSKQNITTPRGHSLVWRHHNYKCHSKTCDSCLSSGITAHNNVYGGSIVEEAFEGAGYGHIQSHDITESNSWNVLWNHAASQCIDGKTHQKKSVCAAMLEVGNTRPIVCNQCNFFLGAGQKCIFAQHLRRVNEKYGQFGILPIHDLSKPDELANWVGSMRADLDADWVLKPCIGGLSDGIEFVRAPSAMSDPDHFISSLERTYRSKKQFTVAQRFLSKPFLIDSRKFHARVYVLLTSYHPFYRAWVSSNGFIFHTTAEHNVRDVSSIVFSQVSSTVLSRPLSDLWEYVRMKGGDPAKVWKATRRILNQLFESYTHTAAYPGAPFTQPFDRAVNGDCFDLFGVDVLFDEALNPYVLEVNSGPNIKVNDQYTQQQSPVKKQLVQSIVRWISAKQTHEQLPPAARQQAAVEMLERHLGLSAEHTQPLDGPRLEHLFAMVLEEQALTNISASGAFEWLPNEGGLACVGEASGACAAPGA